MEVRHIVTRNNTRLYLLYDDELNRVEPVFKYMKARTTRKLSINTLKNQAFHLKTLFEYLEMKDMDYLELVTPSDGKSIFDKLVDYKIYLTYGEYDKKITPIVGREQIRDDRTVNQMVSTVLTFYGILALTEDNVPELNYYMTKYNNLHFHGLLGQMQHKKVRAKENLLMNKVQEKPLEYIVREQYEELLKVCTCRRDRIILGLGFYGGMRISEIIGLHIEDLRDIDENIVWITKRDDRNNPDAFVKYNSIGSTVVADEVRDEIIQYLIDDLHGIDTDYVIINFKGDRKHKPMRRNTINDMLRRIGSKVGIKGFHSHMLRHGCAIDMLTHGCSILEIQDKLRHKGATVTARVYAKYDIKEKKAITEKYTKSVKKDLENMNVNLDWLYEDGEEDD